MIDFETMYNNLQKQLIEKQNNIEIKSKEISIIEAEMLKITGALEMLEIISKQMQENKTSCISSKDEEKKEVNI